MLIAVAVPEYHSYVNTCVHHSQNQTFLSSTIRSAAVNYAAFPGNKDLTEGMSSYNYNLNDQCTSSETILSQKYPEHSNYRSYLEDLINKNSSFSVSDTVLLFFPLTW